MNLTEFNDEKQNLDILVEECAETIVAVQKIARFGMESDWTGTTNRQQLTQECGDLLAMIEVLIANGTLSKTKLDVAMCCKLTKLEKFYQR